MLLLIPGGVLRPRGQAGRDGGPDGGVLTDLRKLADLALQRLVLIDGSLEDLYCEKELLAVLLRAAS